MATHTAARGSTHTSTSRHGTPKTHCLILGVLTPLLLTLLLAAPAATYAGRASSGQLLFYPCTKCHPVGSKPASSRPNDFAKHEIELEIHDVLGKKSAACLVCHSSPKADPGKLKLIDGSTADITNKAAVSRVCYRCHENKYREWKVGAHGKRPGCTAAGCHDPHTPGWISISPLLPFIGTSIQVKVLPEREPFRALPPAPNAPPIETPGWLVIMSALGAITAAAITGTLLFERLDR